MKTLQTDQSVHEYIAKMKPNEKIRIKSHVEIQFCQKYPQNQYFD